MHKHLYYYFNLLLNLLLPKQCFGCSAFIGDLFCNNCSKTLSPILYQESILTYKHYFFSDYNNLVKDFFHYVKFSNQVHLLSFVSGLLSNIETDQFKYFDYWVPIPYHQSRLRKRGFNVLELLFLAFFEKCGVPQLNLFDRKINTEPLFDKTIDQRKKILQEAFSFKIEPSIITNKKILLVDDIVTTGSTIRECLTLLSQTKFTDIAVMSYAKVLNFNERIS